VKNKLIFQYKENTDFVRVYVSDGLEPKKYVDIKVEKQMLQDNFGNKIEFTLNKDFIDERL
jgi:uncharacterized protein (UPF0248 family)